MQFSESCEEGLCRLNAEPFDFNIVDQGSPHFEGRCGLGRSIEKNRHLPVLVVARCHNMPTYLEAIQLGAVDYLAEPVRASCVWWTPICGHALQGPDWREHAAWESLITYTITWPGLIPPAQDRWVIVIIALVIPIILSTRCVRRRRALHQSRTRLLAFFQCSDHSLEACLHVVELRGCH